MAAEDDSRWYAVRSLFETPGEVESGYEERITLWQAGSLDEALEKASAEAAEYAAFAGATYLADFAQVYQVADVPPRDGSEVFSLTRDSPLLPQRYIERFFDSGGERQQ
ncbi:MAG: hypothetical protein JWP40_3357 [Blastococcus sp.]|nr:hypothetical protein [Blastococcus sp.]